MPNLFNDMQDSVFDTAATVFGASATWMPEEGSEEQSCQGLFNDPDTVKKLGTTEYLPTDATFEYRVPNFPGLKESAGEGGNQVISVEGTDYDVRFVKAVHDGKTLIAVLQIKS